MMTVEEALRECHGVFSLADELWGLGFTIVRRQQDALYVDERIIPRGMAYQWCATKSGRDGSQSTADFYGKSGWSPVPASRHDGIFAPAGYQGDIEFGGLILMEKPKAEVDAELAANAAKAHKQVDDWAQRNAAAGFSGAVHVGDSELPVGEPEPRNQTGIPRDLVPYIAEILAERDLLMSRFNSNDKANDRAIALRHAIKTIRDRHKEELNAAQSDAEG